MNFLKSFLVKNSNIFVKKIQNENLNKNLFIMITTETFSATRNTFEGQKVKFVAFVEAAMFSQIRQFHPTKLQVMTGKIGRSQVKWMVSFMKNL